MTGRIGAMGTAPHEWYYAGRDHVFFAAEPDIHHGLARRIRPAASTARRCARRLTGSDNVELTRVELLPHSVVAAASS